MLAYNGLVMPTRRLFLAGLAACTPARAGVQAANPAKNRRRVGMTRPLYASMSYNNRQPLGGAGNTGIEPAVAVFAKREAFVEQDDIVPLRPLRLMHGQRIAIVEFVRLPADLRA